VTTFANRVPTFVTGQTPKQLQKRIATQAATTQQMVDVISIQKVDGVWFAWFYHKLDDLNLPAQPRAEDSRNPKAKETKLPKNKK